MKEQKAILTKEEWEKMQKEANETDEIMDILIDEEQQKRWEQITKEIEEIEGNFDILIDEEQEN